MKNSSMSNRSGKSKKQKLLVLFKILWLVRNSENFCPLYGVDRKFISVSAADSPAPPPYPTQISEVSLSHTSLFLSPSEDKPSASFLGKHMTDRLFGSNFKKYFGGALKGVLNSLNLWISAWPLGGRLGRSWSIGLCAMSMVINIITGMMAYLLPELKNNAVFFAVDFLTLSLYILIAVYILLRKDLTLCTYRLFGAVQFMTSVWFNFYYFIFALQSWCNDGVKEEVFKLFLISGGSVAAIARVLLKVPLGLAGEQSELKNSRLYAICLFDYITRLFFSLLFAMGIGTYLCGRTSTAPWLSIAMPFVVGGMLGMSDSVDDSEGNGIERVVFKLMKNLKMNMLEKKIMANVKKNVLEKKYTVY